MDFIQSHFPSLYRSLPSKQIIFEAVVIRDYRVLVALIVSFVLSTSLVVFDVRYWWSYEKKKRQIILLPAQTQLRDQGCGAETPPAVQPASPVGQRGGKEERVEELFVAAQQLSTSSSTSPRSRRRARRTSAHSYSCPEKSWDDQ